MWLPIPTNWIPCVSPSPMVANKDPKKGPLYNQWLVCLVWAPVQTWTALDWFTSHLSDTSFSVAIDHYFSLSAWLTCEVPQGSVLGPILFSLEILPFGSLFSCIKVNKWFWRKIVDCWVSTYQHFGPLAVNLIEKLKKKFPLINFFEGCSFWAFVFQGVGV